MIVETTDWAAVQRQFPIEPGVIYLNNGSFGPCPTPVIETAADCFRTLETNPQRFLSEYRRRVAEEKHRLADFVGSRRDEIVFITNVTVGMNMVANGLRALRPGDEIVTTDQEYGAVRNIWDYTAERKGMRVRTVALPTPPESSDEIVDLLMGACTDATKLIVMSHITSPTGLLMPVSEVCRLASERGIYTVIDGAHAPGMIPLDIASIGCDFYTGNCHKWLCAPKGSGFLYSRADRQHLLDPLVVGWGWDRNEPTFLGNFENPGTHNPSMYVGAGAAVRFQQEIGGRTIVERDLELAELLRSRLETIRGARLLTSKSRELAVAMTTVALSRHEAETLRDALAGRRIVLPGIGCSRGGGDGDAGHPTLRVSTHIYNDAGQIDVLVEALEESEGRNV